MILYFDTSALFRLYVPEPGYEEICRAARRSKACCTHLIAYAEFHAAVAKAERMNRLSTKEVETILGRFERDWAALMVIQVDDLLVRRAAALARQFGLRGYDSVHLAAAERLALSTPAEALRIASFDAGLNRATADLGLRLLETIPASG